MNVQVEHPTQQSAVLHLEGRFDAAALASALKAIPDDRQVKYLFADMARVSFIDSLGLAGLVNTLKMTEAQGRKFFILNPAEVVYLLLDLTGMNKIFRTVSSVDEALRPAQFVQQGVKVLAMPARLDAASAQNFRASVFAEIDSTTQLILDASQTRFIDSLGLAVLVSCYKHTTNHNGLLAIAGLHGAARQIFELTRMDTVFTLYPTLADAQAALEKRS